MKKLSVLSVFLIVSFQLSAQIWGSTSSGQQQHIKIKMKNETKKDVWVLVHYLPYTGGSLPSEESEKYNWESKGWYKLSKGQTYYLVDTYNKVYYFYATTSTDFFGSYKEWRGSYGFSFEGKTYGFRMMQMNNSEIVEGDGDNDFTYTLRLTR